MATNEERLRRILFDLQWQPQDYTDDGEMQSMALKPYVDFKRDPVERLYEAMKERRHESLGKHKAEVEQLKKEILTLRDVVSRG